MSKGLFATACSYVDAGLSVIPIRCDGSKSPAIAWKTFTQRRATCRELHSWFFQQGFGIGIVAGFISQGLEILDFDHSGLFFPWVESLPDELTSKLTVISTPGGWHAFYRCIEIGSNSKIAIAPAELKSTLIETRGENGYVLAPGSPENCHPSGLTYIHTDGPPLTAISSIRPEERRMLFAAARKFDRRATAEMQRLKARANGWDRRRPIGEESIPEPVRWFNQTHTWSDVLAPYGWTSFDLIHWTRPGKRIGTSACVLETTDGSEILAVHSSNAGPLAPTSGVRKLSKFEAWKWLRHAGNGREAFIEIRKEMVNK